MTANDLWPRLKTIGFCTQCGTPAHQIWDLSKLPFLRYHVYEVITIWPLLTPKWPLTLAFSQCMSKIRKTIKTMRTIASVLYITQCSVEWGLQRMPTVTASFNQKVKWLSDSLPIWEETFQHYILLTRHVQKCKDLAVLTDMYLYRSSNQLSLLQTYLDC